LRRRNGIKSLPRNGDIPRVCGINEGVNGLLQGGPYPYYRKVLIGKDSLEIVKLLLGGDLVKVEDAAERIPVTDLRVSRHED
jgi:hypothetical protein